MKKSTKRHRISHLNLLHTMNLNVLYGDENQRNEVSGRLERERDRETMDLHPTGNLILNKLYKYHFEPLEGLMLTAGVFWVIWWREMPVIRCAWLTVAPQDEDSCLAHLCRVLLVSHPGPAPRRFPETFPPFPEWNSGCAQAYNVTTFKSIVAIQIRTEEGEHYANVSCTFLHYFLPI